MNFVRSLWIACACIAGSAVDWIGLSQPHALMAQEATGYQPDEAHFRDHVRPFLDRHCLQCHGPDEAMSDLRVDTQLSADLSNRVNRELWTEVVNALNGHSMPPDDQPQPSVEDVSLVVDWVARQASLAQQSARDSQVVLRRLNREEYRNTIRDLTGVEFDIDALPQDPSAGGFDNNGFALSLSPLHLELYHESARKIIDQAMVLGDQPPSIRWKFEVDSGDSDSNRVTYDGQRVIVNGGNNPVEAGFKRIHHANWDKGISIRDFRLANSGEYIVRIRAASLVPDRQAVVAGAEFFLAQRRDREIGERPMAERWIREQFDTDLNHFRTDRMYDYGPARMRVTRTLGGQPEVVAEFDVPATLDDPEVHEFRVSMTTQGAGFGLEYAYSIPRVLENFWMQSGEQFARPELLIDWMELEGPVFDQWPPQSTQLVLGETLPRNIESLSPTRQREIASRVVSRFMNRAYRRNVSEEEVEQRLAHFDQAIEEESGFVEALKAPLIATVVSPHFLFFVETEKSSDSSNQLTAHERACRLSYFLWSTMPDEELRRLADDGSLLNDEVYRSQIQRMLADPRAEALVQNFTSQWLGLRQVGANPPAEDLFPQYDRHLELSMVGESLALFREVLNHDLPLTTFVSSDFVMINERLARYYGIDGVRGDAFQRVELPDGVSRGGVMTHASILTVTSNGTRTSPVKRGTWILQTLLGIDPGLPVANVGEIQPKVPGIDRATVRQRLEIHRTLPQCARCHSKIDPLGFALENFDAAGAWRDQEGFGYKGRVQRDDPMIDASSQLPDGTAIVGVEGLQQALLAQKELFYRCLAEKLLTYALGRELGLSDRLSVDQAVAHLQQPGNDSLRELIEHIAMSEIFLSP